MLFLDVILWSVSFKSHKKNAGQSQQTAMDFISSWKDVQQNHNIWIPALSQHGLKGDLPAVRWFDQGSYSSKFFPQMYSVRKNTLMKQIHVKVAVLPGTMLLYDEFFFFASLSGRKKFCMPTLTSFFLLTCHVTVGLLWPAPTMLLSCWEQHPSSNEGLQAGLGRKVLGFWPKIPEPQGLWPGWTVEISK